MTLYVYERRSGGWNVDLGKRKELCVRNERLELEEGCLERLLRRQ